MTKASASLARDAQTYADRGWSVFPVSGKKPAVPSWKKYRHRPAGAAELQDLCARPGVSGLAVILGRASGGLACRDFDTADSYDRWAAANPLTAAAVPTAKTARGFHVYGRLDREAFVTHPDGELRADSGHYVILPPSRHPSGVLYEWLSRPGDRLPPLPESLLGGQKGNAPQQPSNTACHACVTSAAQEAILATLPSRAGQRNRLLFDLARRLMAIPDLDTSPAALKAVVIEWYRLALPVIGTKDFDESWADFQVAWLNAKTPHGATISAAFEAARRHPQPPIDGNPSLGVLAEFCGRLAGAGGKFFLSVRTVAECFRVSDMTASRLLTALQFHRVITKVSAGRLKDRQATTWRYVGGCGTH